MYLLSEPRKWSELKIKLLNVCIDIDFLLNNFIMHLLIDIYKSYLWIREETRLLQNNIYSKNDKQQYWCAILERFLIVSAVWFTSC